MKTEKAIKIAKIVAIPVVIFVLILVAGAWVLESSVVYEMEGPEPHGPGGLHDPAEVYCIEQGYHVEPPKDGQDSTCVFPDGSECPKYEFYSNECGQEWAK